MFSTDLVPILGLAAALVILAVLLGRLMPALIRQARARAAVNAELRAALEEYNALARLTVANLGFPDHFRRLQERVKALQDRLRALAQAAVDQDDRAFLEHLARRVDATGLVLRASALQAWLLRLNELGLKSFGDQASILREELRLAQRELGDRCADKLLGAVGVPDEVRAWKVSAREHLDALYVRLHELDFKALEVRFHDAHGKANAKLLAAVRNQLAHLGDDINLSRELVSEPSKLDELERLGASVERLVRESVIKTPPDSHSTHDAATVAATLKRLPSKADRRVPARSWMRATHADTRAASLLAFERALALEAHTLSRWPRLLWQQLHNRLQWEGDPIRALLDRERAARSAPGSPLWLRTRTPFRESGSLIRTLEGHSESFNACAVAPNGSFIVSAGGDGTLKLWETDTGVELVTLKGHTGSVSACAVSPDGRFVVSGGGDGTLKVWDAATGDEVCALAGHTQAVVGCSYDSTGRLLVSAAKDWTLRVWDVTTRRERLTIRVQDLPVGPAFTRDGLLIVSATGKTLKVWDVESGRERKTLGSHEDYVTSCAVIPDGDLIASASVDSTVRLWNLSDGIETHVLKAHATGREVWCVAFSPDGSFLVSGGADGKLIFWDTSTGARLATLKGHARSVTACAVAGDGSLLVSASSDHTVKVWRTDSLGESRETVGHDRAVFGCAIGGGRVVSAGGDGAVKVWDLSTLHETSVLHHRLEAWGCAVTPDGSVVVSGGEDDILRIWERFAPGGALKCESRSVRACAISADGMFLVSGGLDGCVKIWRRPTAGELAYRQRVERIMRQAPDSSPFLLGTLSGHKGPVDCCAISCDGGFIVSGSEDATLKIWDVATHRLRASLAGHTGTVWCCAISRDGSFIASGGDDATIRIWDVATASERRVLTHVETVRGCSIAPDGAFVVSSSTDKLLRVWEVGSGKTVACLPLSGEVLCAAWDPREPLIACGDRGGSLHIVELLPTFFG